MVAASSSNQYQHYLLVNDDMGRREYVLTESTYSLGRKSSCTIYLHSQFVSRLHATLLRCLRNDGSSYYRIVDGDGFKSTSANGIIVNSKKVAAQELKHGDAVVFGPQVFAVYEYRLSGTPTDNRMLTEEDDPFDITLIDPGMIDDGDDGDDEVSTQLLDPTLDDGA